ncbi:hypothetical protein DSM106972_041810 [Dulcicalothrix desertica PCC 7102]|uniref:Uncharacterized protein n=1 Tax=Dulcicalothrix desertica PCC 7102 TaxID=232991 RepID=A0A3S1AMU6_9CYAN|nr:hypothetical protein [Dulcicalothrix desertica]RUT04612.1 hypothetical protein DSM106972_041810 [Dulcicalothrix desertica PCC 7102]TWH42618.1 hypothetical protein CAL7102_06292 [Dulcicalothrix desertica PCC 7102]
MMSPHLDDIKRSIGTLSLEEQEWLLERISEQVHHKKQLLDKFADAEYMAEQIAQMAQDPEIQAEIAAINQEFIVTEMDGLLGKKYIKIA